MASLAAVSAPDLATDRARLRSPRKFGARSREWFWKVRTAELVGHCGHPTPTQAALIDRYISLEWELRRRIAAGDITFAERLEAEKALRRDLRELGLAPRPEPPADPVAAIRASLAAYAASKDDAA